ncbi:MAG TPA: ABC transporter ATP-binding protein [Verrucomicrobiae bacterium]
MPPVGPILKLQDVTRCYDSPDGGGGLVVLDHLSLEIARGESVAVVGPSGSGKSTLLQIIGTLDRPTSGQVLFEGTDLSTLDEIQTAMVRNEKLGFVFQAHYLLPQCTVLENVLVPTLARTRRTGVPPVSELGSPPNGDSREAGPAGNESPASRAQRLLARVGLSARLSHRPGQLSGGERQRVAVVRALINQPALLLADEPTGSLDQASAEQLAKLLAELNLEEKVTLVVVTHSRDLATRMRRVLELKNGHLLPADPEARPPEFGAAR